MRDHNKRSFPNDIHILESQVFNTEVFESALKGIDHVIYTLSIPEQYEHDTGIFHAVNYELLNMLTKAGSKRLTYISTYEVFQAIDGAIRETHPVVNGEWALHCQRSDDLIEIHRRDTETVCRFLCTLQSTGEDGQDGCHSPGVDIKIYWIDNVQIDFITNGSEPVSERTVHELGWNPVSLDEGIVKFLEMRPIG